MVNLKVGGLIKVSLSVFRRTRFSNLVVWIIEVARKSLYEFWSLLSELSVL